MRVCVVEKKSAMSCSVRFGRFPFFRFEIFLIVVGGRCEKKVRKEKRPRKEGRGARGGGRKGVKNSLELKKGVH